MNDMSNEYINNIINSIKEKLEENNIKLRKTKHKHPITKEKEYTITNNIITDIVDDMIKN